MKDKIENHEVRKAEIKFNDSGQNQTKPNQKTLFESLKNSRPGQNIPKTKTKVFYKPSFTGFKNKGNSSILIFIS